MPYQSYERWPAKRINVIKRGKSYFDLPRFSYCCEKYYDLVSLKKDERKRILYGETLFNSAGPAFHRA